jgi:hypothetical protein
MLRRRRGVGVLGTMAVGGVAYAAGSSAARGRANEQAQNAQIAELQNQMATQNAPPPPQYAPPPPGPGPASMDDKLEQLQKLSELRAAGVITDEDVAVQKARILAT